MEKVILIRVKFGQLTFRKYLKVQESHWLKLVSFSPSSCFTSLLIASVNEMLAAGRSLGVVNRTVSADLNK